jgi:hypothetical protein
MINPPLIDPSANRPCCQWVTDKYFMVFNAPNIMTTLTTAREARCCQGSPAAHYGRGAEPPDEPVTP